MSKESKRFQWIRVMIADSFKLSQNVVYEVLTAAGNRQIIDKFLDGEGPNRFFAYYQTPEGVAETDKNLIDPVLFLTYGDTQKIKDKAVWFLRCLPQTKKQINTAEFNNDEVMFGEITPNPVIILDKMMDMIYEPMLNQLKKEEWGVSDAQSRIQFLNCSEKFKNEVSEAIKLMSPGEELFQIDQEELKRISNLSPNERIQTYENKFEAWLKTIQTLLSSGGQNKTDNNQGQGPKTELDYWRKRMQEITNWSEQLKSKDFNMVKMALIKQRQQQGKKEGQQNINKLMLNFQRIDLALTDKLNEAKDNVKYLSTLEKFIEPLYTGTPQQIIDTLPSLMNAIKMIHTIARFYNTSDKMTGLFIKITNQMIKNCKQKILPDGGKGGGKTQEVWKRPPAEIIQVLGSCIRLNREYKQAYNVTKEKGAEMTKGKFFNFSQTQIFNKFDLFVKRLQKLIEVFSNIQQFEDLKKHNFQGMEPLIETFNKHLTEFKKKRTSDLLDIRLGQFDRDYVIFNIDISQLDNELQAFIDANFAKSKSIEHSLKLLKKFQSTIKRDALKHNLTSKYNTILHNYATELDAIQRVFNDHRTDPHMVRNMPEIAGKIIWSKHLFQKITGPIHMFPQNVINSSEIKKYYGNYNTLGKQLTINEMWYYNLWVNEIERSKAALQATLIVRHQTQKKLYVNFDVDIMQLIRQAKCLDRQGISIPESARIILLQEDKFKMYYNQLLYVLKEYERIIGKIKPICKNLLAPHISDLQLKLHPGMSTLTWTSMNIDSYLHHVYQGLNKLEQLIINVNDIIENRIQNNLRNISKVSLVSLPHENVTFTLETFVSMQQEYINEKKNLLTSKNVQVERAVDDLIQTISLYPLDVRIDPVKGEEIKKIKRYYFWYLYQALLNATQNSLNSMKYRVCGNKGSTQQKLNPFFEVDVQLSGNQVRLNPSLEEIQKSINKAATAVLRCSKKLYNWDQQNSDDKKTFYQMIAQDKQIVKVILLLTGSIQGTKNKVNEFISKFNKYDWLWNSSIAKSLKQFSKGYDKPQLQAYEDELKKFSHTQQDIDKIEPTFIIGAMKLKTQSLALGLKSYCKEWKNEYSEDLHKRARVELDKLTENIKELSQKLSKTVVKDIDSLGIVMEKLQEIRKLQAVIDISFNPVIEMYALLDNYQPGSVGDKDQMDARSMLRRNWDSLILQSEGIGKNLTVKQTEYLKKLKNNIRELAKDVVEFRADYEKNGPMVTGIAPKQAIERLKRFDEQYEVREQQYKINKKGEELFGLQEMKYPALEQTKNELTNLKKLYNLYSDVINAITQFQELHWEELVRERQKIDKMEEDVKRYKELCAKLPPDLKEWPAYKELKQSISNLENLIPIIIILRKESIKDRHWEALNEKCSHNHRIPYDQIDSFTVQDLIRAKVLELVDDIQEIGDSADKQKKIESALNEIQSYWDVRDFAFGNWGKRENAVLSGIAVQEITEKLEEDQMTLSSINAQRHVLPFKKRVEELIRVFSETSQILDLWIKVQKLWTNLEPVFTGGDIAKQMPIQAKAFAAIDKTWIKCMQKSFEIKKVVGCCASDTLKDNLPDMQKKLQECQKLLEAYLEGKRKLFPRFYFISDSELLKILSQGSDPTTVQQDFQKLFDAISKVEFVKSSKKGAGPNEKEIKAIMEERQSFKEEIVLSQQVKCQGNIESWLKLLEKQMQESVRQLARKAATDVSASGTPLQSFVAGSISQIALMGIQIIWTSKITEALEKNQKENKTALDQKKKQIDKMLKELTEMCVKKIVSPIQRTKIETLVTVHVHQKDIAVDLKVTSINDFEWQRQTRVYWKQELDHCMVSITDWDQIYAYEYLGAKERLCITPLTDRCYITLAQSLSMFYGGAPAGPAGTGKTETVKDLGRTVGVFVVVTNCSDQHRYRDMAKIFKGLCQSGLWGCFDEFNRIDLEVLSVVAMQVQSINTAKRLKVNTFMFPQEPYPIPIVHTVAYFITMNPGYAGRQELPENLKVLFRGVTMMMPDREIIIKVKLASVGYDYIQVLAKKFNVLYKLCEEQLSKQRHYDFGLRNILSVLRTAGNTKRSELQKMQSMNIDQSKRGDNNEFEEKLLMRSLRDMNLSKLVSDDIPLFEGLLKDIFTKVGTVQKQVYPDVESKIPQMFQNKKELIQKPQFVLKIIQLYETSLVRHGFMLVGPTASGKTTIMNILTETLSQSTGSSYRITRMNPKAITDKQMYGVKSEISDDWIPGVFSTLWQKCNARSSKFYNWLTCDGPVDAIWIQNLNTVLDDNKILTLANGQRIPMTHQCKLVFEVENLNNASPATVSRCGQVYISPTDLGNEPLYEGWCQLRCVERTVDEGNTLKKLFTKYFGTYNICDQTLKNVKGNPPVMAISTPLKIINTLGLVNGLLKGLGQGAKLQEQDYEKVVVYALAWGIGGLFEAPERSAFHQYLQNKGAPLPNKKENETVFDYYLKIENGKAEYHQIIPATWKPSGDKIKFSQLLLPTLDSWRAEYLIDNILNQPRPIHSSTAFIQNGVLLVGGSGTAKTSSVLMYASKFDQSVQLFKRINFSSATSPFLFQASIETECDNKIGKDFAPPQNKKMAVFIDDMSMPFVNKWGDQITLEIVRQLIEQGGFYWLQKSQRGAFKSIKNLSFIGAMNHPGGGRNDIPNRLKRQFFIFNMILPLSIEGIYGPIIKHHFRDSKSMSLTEQVKRVVENLTSATIKLWQSVKKFMLPTPSKFHYVFNMRQLSRVFKGILQIRKQTLMRTERVRDFKPDVYLVGLWRHECQRVFCDKLINSKDKDTVLNYIHDISLDSFPGLENEINDKFARDKVFLFCDFLLPDIKDEQGNIVTLAARQYEAINNLQTLRARCIECMKDYNDDSKNLRKLNLVLFDDALKHLLRISRIIKMPRSSALLVGVGGSGKQSLTRLAASIGKLQIKQIQLVKNYGEKDLKEDIKKYFQTTGRFGRQCCFILTDAEVKKEEFLEYINMILSTGQIPGLLAKDQRETFLGDARNDYCKENKNNPDPPASEIYSYFVDRVRDNLHIVLCFSPVGQKFRDRSRKFPALFNECTIDWFLPWPEEALVSVAETFIKGFKELETTSENKVELMKHMGNVHLMVTDVCDKYYQKMRRQVYVTPKSYLSYLESYKSLYTKKFFELDVEEKNFTIGVLKINEASTAIQQMKIALSGEEKKLKEASEKTDKLLKQLQVEQSRVAKLEAEVNAITIKCQREAAGIAAEKEDAERQLADAIPAQMRAEKAVSELDSASINEMKATRIPQEVLKLNLDAVAIYFGMKLAPVQFVPSLQLSKDVNIPFLKFSFEESGKIILGTGFDLLKFLKTYDKDSINDETIELLEPYLIQGAHFFNEVNSKRVSNAIAAITRWCYAVYEYHEKSQIVKPKRIKLAQEEGKLAIALQNLEKSRQQLAEIKAQLDVLNKNSQIQLNQKRILQETAMKTKKKINTAQTLINSLKDEKSRWNKGANEIQDRKKKLVGNCSLATAFISYCGPFNSDFRTILAGDKFTNDMKNRNLPFNHDLSKELTAFLVDEATVGQWNLQGLPKDDLSIQNGIMVTNSTRYPLLIDPQGQGQGWITKKYAQKMDKNRSLANINNPKFKDQFLKFCLEEGKPLIIQGIENQVDPLMDPVLEKQIVQKKNGRALIKISGVDLDFNKSFELFMTCRLPNPSFSPELSAKTTIIDFTVTQTGLEQQLLGKVISKQQKVLEDSLNTLLTDVNNNKKELQKLDKDLLKRLTESKGNLLDDTQLMEVLNNTKAQAQDVAVKLADAEIKTKQINEKRQQYRPVAIRGSALYFTLIEVSLVNWMYNNSLEQFLTLFNESIDNSQKVQSPPKRVQIIIKFLTKHVYKYVNRGLFEKDKITFVLMMCFKILTKAGKISSDDVGLFLKAGAGQDIKECRPKPQFSFISEKAWLNIIAFSKHCFNDSPVAAFKELPDMIIKNQAGWMSFFEKNNPENQTIPDITERLVQQKQQNRAFMTLCLIRSVREDRTLVACTAFINAVLGTEFTEPISYPIQSIWAESKYYVPILFLLSAGADPTSSVDQFARKKKKYPTEKVSMGEGQEQVARKVIKICTQSGGWVILQNCQLGLRFMEEIEQTIIGFSTGETVKPHQDFRLWITCQPHNKFPLGLLQKVIKVTNQPPKGLKAGLNKTFTTLITQQFLQKVDSSSWRNMIFTICFFHSIVVQRRKFGSLGWCIPYQFNNSDLEASLMFVQKYLTSLATASPGGGQQASMNMYVVKYMICQVQYGGRITDDLDRELCNAYGNDYLKEQMLNVTNQYTYFDDPRDRFKYKIPLNPGVELTKYQEYINSMPATDDPSIFGLHPNADLTFRLKESLEMINTIMETRPKESSAGGGKTREEQVKEKASDLINKLPVDYIDQQVKESIRKLGSGNKNLSATGMAVPLNVFLYQEIARMQKVISIVRKTLIDICEAIDGQIIMTPDILDAINAVFDAKVPNQWVYDPTGAEIAWIIPTLAKWFNDLIERNKQLYEWMKGSRPVTFWLGGFFNPQGFLTAMKQQVTRTHKEKLSKQPSSSQQPAWSLDDVSYSTNVKDKDIEQLSKDKDIEGVYIRDLMLQGCRWHRNTLQDSRPREMFFPLPILHVTAVNKKKPGEQKNSYDCPVYKYPRRTDKYLIFRVKLPSDQDAQKWKLRGVALLCATE